MEDSVKQRLMKFMSYREMSASRFERMCGLSNGYFNKLRNAPGLDKIDKMLRVFPELNREWVLTGEGSMLNEGYTTFEPVGVAVSSSPEKTETEKENVILKAQLAEKEKMITILEQQLAELNTINKGLMTTLTNVVTSSVANKKSVEE